jgi:hypothetical protein
MSQNKQECARCTNKNDEAWLSRLKEDSKIKIVRYCHHDIQSIDKIRAIGDVAKHLT